MAMPDAYRAITLLEFNPGVVAAVAFLNPLAAQIDLLIALGLGPFQLSLAAQFNAMLALQAQLSLNIGLGTAGLLETLKATLQAVITIQAAIAVSLSLGLPPISISLSAELSASVALAGALKLQLGGLQLLIKAALAIKIPALAFALGLNLNAGPFFAISFSGVTLQNAANWLSAEVAGGGLSADSQYLAPTDQVFGVFIFGAVPSIQAAFNAIIAVPP